MRRCITIMKSGAFSTTRYASSKKASTIPRPPSSRSPQQRSTRNRRPGSLSPRPHHGGAEPTTGGDRLFSPGRPPGSLIHSSAASVNSVAETRHEGPPQTATVIMGKKRKESHGIISWRDEPSKEE